MTELILDILEDLDNPSYLIFTEYVYQQNWQELTPAKVGIYAEKFMKMFLEEERFENEYFRNIIEVALDNVEWFRVGLHMYEVVKTAD